MNGTLSPAPGMTHDHFQEKNLVNPVKYLRTRRRGTSGIWVVRARERDCLIGQRWRPRHRETESLSRAFSRAALTLPLTNLPMQWPEGSRTASTSVAPRYWLRVGLRVPFIS